MDILTRLELIDVLTLQDQRQWFFRTLHGFGESERLFISFESVKVVITFELVRCSSPGVAPHTILEHLIPHISPTRSGSGGIAAHLLRIDRQWILAGHD